MAVDSANHLGGKTCAQCGAWESKPAGVQQQSKGECRKNSPSIAGWPKTMPNDWCRAWEPDERPVSRPSSFDCPDIPAPIGFDYRYVRDYPASAKQWISAARDAADIPPDLQPLLADPLAGVFLPATFLPSLLKASAAMTCFAGPPSFLDITTAITAITDTVPFSPTWTMMRCAPRALPPDKPCRPNIHGGTSTSPPSLCAVAAMHDPSICPRPIDRIDHDEGGEEQ